VVVVLSGVDDSAGYFGKSQGGPVNRGYFHKIWSSGMTTKLKVSDFQVVNHRMASASSK